MTAYQSCSDTSDAIEFFPAYYLYLKPVARFNISVQFPTMKRAGQAISHLEVMEKLKSLIAPEKFTSLKVAKSTLEFIRFEAEIESKPKLSSVMAALNSKVIRLTGFNDSLKIRVAEAKSTVPTRHMWDSFFHNAKDMNDRVPGERPDTLYISNIPCKWFVSRHDKNKGNNNPSEYILKKVFEVFGEIRFVDIPCNDPYRNKSKGSFSGIKTFTFGQEHIFDCYVQYKEYISFVKAMDTLRGMKLLFNDGDVAFTANIKVDYDRTKYMSDASINRRQAEREKFRVEEKNAENILMKEAAMKEKQHSQKKKKEGLDGKTNRVLKKFKRKCKKDIHFKIIVEERKLLMAQRKLESIRLLDVILERVKKRREQELEKEKKSKKKHKDPHKEESDEESLRKRQAEVIAKRLQLEAEEQEIRQKLIMKYKTQQKEEMKLKKEEIMAAYDGQQQTEEIDLTLSDSQSTSDCSPLADKKTWQHSQDNRTSGGGEYCCHKHDCQKNNCRLQECYHHHFTQRFHQKRGFFPRRQMYRPNWHSRGRGAKFSQGYQGGYKPFYTDYSVINMEYYRYFRKLAKLDDSKDSNSDKDYSPFSMPSSYSRHSHTYSKSRSASHDKSASCRKSRYSSRYRRKYSRSTSRHQSRRSRSTSRHRSRRSRSTTRHQSRRSRSTSRHGSRRSRSSSRHRSKRSRSTSRHHCRRSWSTSRHRSRRSRSTSRYHSRRSRSTSRHYSRRSRHHSRSSRSTSKHRCRRSRSTSRHCSRRSCSYSRRRSRSPHSHSRHNSRSQGYHKESRSLSKSSLKKSSHSKIIDMKSENSRERRSCSKISSSSRGHSHHSSNSNTGRCYSPFRKSSKKHESLSPSQSRPENLEIPEAENIKLDFPKKDFMHNKSEDLSVNSEGNAMKYAEENVDKISDLHVKESDMGIKQQDKILENANENSKMENKTQHKKNKKHKKHKHRTHKKKKE